MTSNNLIQSLQMILANIYQKEKKKDSQLQALDKMSLV